MLRPASVRRILIQCCRHMDREAFFQIYFDLCWYTPTDS